MLPKSRLLHVLFFFLQTAVPDVVVAPGRVLTISGLFSFVLFSSLLGVIEPRVVVSFILLIYQEDHQLLADTDCVGLAALALDHFGADDLQPSMGHPLAAFTTLDHDLLGRDHR